MEGYRCGARGDTSKETLRAESPCAGAAVLCRAEARAPRARTAARGSAQDPETTSTGAPRSASAPRVALRPAPSRARPPVLCRRGRGATGRGRAGRSGGCRPCTARRGAARARPRSAAVRLPGRRQRRGGARWRPGWGRGCWPWPWGRQVRGGHGGRRGRGWARLVLLPRGRAEAWSSPSVPGSGWELCVGGGGCVGTGMLQEYSLFTGAVPLARALVRERRFTSHVFIICGIGMAAVDAY